MGQSKKTKRGINQFNRAKNPIYGAKRIFLYDDKINSFVETYLKIKEIELDAEIDSEIGEVAGDEIS